MSQSLFFFSSFVLPWSKFPAYFLVYITTSYSSTSGSSQFLYIVIYAVHVLKHQCIICTHFLCGWYPQPKLWLKCCLYWISCPSEQQSSTLFEIHPGEQTWTLFKETNIGEQCRINMNEFKDFSWPKGWNHSKMTDSQQKQVLLWICIITD